MAFSGLHAPKGRGSALNPTGRFERIAFEPETGAGGEAPARAVPTEFFRDTARTVLSRNESADIPFTYSLNPYRGCEHGCIYCYARPYHEYLGFSAGLDFETKILVKEDAPERLRNALLARNWSGEPIALSGVTDPYQPAERRLTLTRRCLQVMAECRQPVSVITKSGLVARDADVLADLARVSAAHVALTLTTLDEGRRRALEPRASSADVRLAAVATLARLGIPVGVMVAPVIPGLTDHEIPAILGRAADAGASWASYVMLRLPHGVGQLFDAWLVAHVPGQRARVLGRVRNVRGGRLNDSRTGSRMRGEGPMATLTARLFARARDRAGLASGAPPLSSAAFRRPSMMGTLFQ
jgi:DNA repair photolyase